MISPAESMSDPGAVTALAISSAIPIDTGDFVVQRTVPTGLTIAEMIAVSGIDRKTLRRARCWIKEPATDRETFVPQDLWKVVRPKPGMSLTLRIRPSAGGGGGGSKSGIGILLSVVVMIAVAFVTWGVGNAVLLAGYSATAAAAAGAIAGAVAPITGKLMIFERVSR
ncbi:hypothetical protein [Dongia sp.]|uniref:hypothetical protein n=1 Tax=Dongia sp. TaxID=1977262 RepID=UPI0035AEEA64